MGDRGASERLYGMKPGIPWSVKGIDQEAREAAKDAARRSGMTLGEWLNILIKEQADEAEPARMPRTREPARAGSLADDITSRLDRLADQLNSLTREGTDTAANRFAPHAVHAAVETHSIATLVDRVERNEREAAALLSDLVDRIGRLEQTSQELASRPVVEAPQRPEDVPGYAALEGALRNIVAHIETSDTRMRDTLKSVQDRLANLAARADQADRAQSQHASQSAALEYLEDRVGELAQKLADGGKSARREIEAHVQQQIGSEVSKLSQRIDSVRAAQEGLGTRIESVAAEAAQRETRGLGTRISGEIGPLSEQIKALKLAQDNLSQKLQASSLQAAQREAREVERRLQSAIAELQRDKGPQQEAAREIQRVTAAIESLEQRFEDIKMEAASEREVKSLKLSLEQVSATVTQIASARPTEDLEQRLADFGKRLDNPALPAQVASHIEDLETRIHHLDARLKETMVAASDSVSLGTFETEIRQTAERMAAMEHRIDHIATIERSVAQLYASLDESRGAARGMAEEAARETAERLISDAGLASSGPSPELQAMEAGLNAVRASVASADRHTQETLEAVHETLEQIVARLAEIEAREEPAPAPYQPAQPQPQTFAARLREPSLPTFEPHEPELPPAEPSSFDDLQDWQPPSARAPLPDTSAEPEEDEPGEFDPGPLPDEPVPATEPARFGHTEEHPHEDPQADVVREDFIAAARRAAQTAARPQSPILNTLSGLSRRRGGMVEEPAPRQETRGSRFRIPFLRPRAKASEPEIAAESEESSETSEEKSGGSRKRLILAGLVLLAAVAAYTANRTLNTGHSGRTLAPESTSSINAPTAARDMALDTAPSPSSMSETELTVLEHAAEDPLSTASLGPTSTRDRAVSDRLDQDESFSPKSNFENSGTAPLPTSALQQASMPPTEAGTQSLRQAALAGDPNAAFIVASRYLEGRDMTQDYERAAEWFARAASKGLAPAQYRLATLYERGRGVPQDRQAAMAWYLKAAENGNVKSMHNLAVLYTDNADGAPQYDQAAHWFEQAARHGLKDSQFNLAVLAERGLGTAQSPEDAYLWYSLAAKQGDGDAGAKAKGLEATMKPAQLDDLRQRIAAWTAETAIREANYVAAIDPAWQVAEGQPGTLDSALDAASSAPAPQLQATSPRGEQLFGKALIQRAQELLAGHGFDIGTPDGVMGARTADAVRLYQSQNGLPINGMVTNDLIRSLEGSRI